MIEFLGKFFLKIMQSLYSVFHPNSAELRWGQGLALAEVLQVRLHSLTREPGDATGHLWAAWLWPTEAGVFHGHVRARGVTQRDRGERCVTPRERAGRESRRVTGPAEQMGGERKSVTRAQS